MPLALLFNTDINNSELEVAKRYVTSNMTNPTTTSILKCSIMSAVPTVNNILRAALTFGASSAACESTFSVLGRVLTPYRRSMLHPRKANLVLLAFESDLADELLTPPFKERIMRNFCAKETGRRLPLY